jgi:nitric oxide reductase subunit B
MSFFGFNIGLLLLTLGTLFPVGVLQAWTSYKQGLWMARDASFFEQGFVRLIGMVRIIPDLTIICLGVIPLAYFLFRTYRNLKPREIQEGESIWSRLGMTL